MRTIWSFFVCVLWLCASAGTEQNDDTLEERMTALMDNIQQRYDDRLAEQEEHMARLVAEHDQNIASLVQRIDSLEDTLQHIKRSKLK